MKIKVYNGLIFWNTLTDNKPSRSYLANLENQMQEVDMHVNQDSYYSISVVSRTKDISYIITELNNHKQYWFFNGIGKILPNGYLLNFQLDIYATYTLTFFDKLKADNVKVKLNRSHKFTKTALMFEDQLLELVPKFYDGYVDSVHSISTIQKLPNTNWEVDLGGGTIEYLTNNNKGPVGSPANRYYVFRDLNQDGYLMLFPVLVDTHNPNNNIVDVFGTLRAPNKPHARVKLLNKDTDLEWFRQSEDVSNKFLGIFTFPNFYNFRNSSLKYEIIDYEYQYTLPKFHYNLPPQKVTISGSVIALTLKPSGEKINFPIYISGNNFGQHIDVLAYNEQITSLNYQDKPHQYILDYYDYEIWNNRINASSLYSSMLNNIVIDNWVFFFSQNGVVKYFANDPTDIYPLSGGIINFPADLPVWVDTYLNYVNANKNQRDNQLNIYKQQFLIKSLNSVTTNVESGLMGSFGLNGVNYATGLANSIIGYYQKLTTMKAQYEDAKNTMGFELQGGNTQDAVIGLIYSNNELGPCDYYVRHKNLTPDTIAQLNNIIYLYGRQLVQIDTLTNFTVRTDFNYYLFDKDYLLTIFSNHVDPIIPIELYSFIINQLTEGIRIWNIQPNY